MPKVSICISTYEMHGVGVKMLARCLNSVVKQTFKDYEIIVSDNSQNKDIYDLTESYNVKYFYNPNIGNAANLNNTIKHANGELLKFLNQDDYFADENSLQDVVKNFTKNTNWLITGCSNNPHPFFSKSENTLGGPSVLTIRNEGHLLFDETLKWVLDLEYYQRLFKKFGHPKILDKVNVIIGEGSHQATHHLSNEEKLREQSLL